MKADDYAKLEKDYSFKRSYLNNTPWWRTLSMLPPICFLFVGLVGILYLFKHDMLISLHLIPYLALFVVGTILLKAIKRYIQKAKISQPGSFLLCLAKPIGEKDGYVYAAFVNDSHRYNKHYINNLSKDISFDAVLEKDGCPFRKQSVLIHDDENNAGYYVRAYEKKDLNKRFVTWEEDGLFPVLYIDDKYTFIVKKKDLTYYGS